MINILIVEDDPFSVDFYKYLFRKAGFNSLVQDNGDDVINMLQSGNINLIIMDINLKNTYLNGQKIDGIRLSSFIKRKEGIKPPPIILISAYRPDSFEGDFMKDSLAEDFITKPIVDFNLLIGKINRLVEN
jgi:two-component system, cell cycle response regulator DivK